MFAAIGFLWTFVGLLGSTLVSTRKKQEEASGPATVVNEIKEIIKEKIEYVEEMDMNEMEDLIRIIRSLNPRNA